MFSSSRIYFPQMFSRVIFEPLKRILLQFNVPFLEFPMINLCVIFFLFFFVNDSVVKSVLISV